MLDPSDYQNTNGVSSGVTNYINSSSNAQAGQAGGGNWMQQAGSWLNSDSMGQGMGMGGMNNGQMILAADQMGGQIFGMLAGQNETKAGNIIKKVPGLSTIGNFVNAAFGSNINEDFVNQTNYGINFLGSRKFNSKTNADVLNDWRASSRMSHVDKSDVGSDGWFSNKAKNKTNSLNEDIDEANKRQLINFGIAVNNADKYTDLRILGGMQAAYGGPINSFRKYYGGGGFTNLITTPMPGTTNNETVRDILSWLPYTSTAIDIDNARKDPSASNLTWAGVSAGLDLLSAGVYSKLKRGLRAVDKAIGVAEKEAASATKRAERAKKVYEQAHTKKNYELNLKAEREAFEKNYRLNNAVDGLYTQRQSYLDDINKYAPWTFEGMGGVESQAIQTFVESARDNTHACGGRLHGGGGYLNQAKALIRQNEGWRDKPYNDAPKGKNWRSVGYGFNDSGFRDKYPEGISKHYEHGITKKQAEEELNYFLNKAEKNLKSIYGKQWNDFTDSQKAAILDTYYQRPASVGKGSRFYKAVTAGEDAGKYLGVAGFSKRNKIRQGVFGGSQDYVNLGAETESPSANSSSLQEATSIPVIQELDLNGITPTQAKAPELNLASPTFDLSMFGSTQTPQESKVPTVGTVEDFLASYGDFGENLFKQGGRLFEGGGSTNGWMDFFKAWGASQGGGNNYFSNMGGNQWKPSSGIQKNTSNGSVQDWLGVAGSAVNTISNWGKEDPSLGRGGGYSDFGMAAYDVMKIIRDATKDRKEPMDKKLGIPIYARGGRLFEGGGSMGAMGYAQIGLSALKLASNAKHQASLDDDIDRGMIDRSINRYGQEFDDAVANVNTNGDLLDLWQNNSTIEPNLTMRDFRDKSYFDDFLNGYAASWEGFNAGAQTGNPYVTAIAAVVGGASSNIASIIGRNKAEDAARETNIKMRKANERRMDSLLAAADRVDKENDYRILQNMGANGGKLNMGFGLRNPFVMPDGTANPLYKAFGGALAHEMDWDTGINWVNEGGSHGENPLGGVPMGVDEQGIPNLVEEGEAIWNGDYVFSKRMKVPKKLREKYKLPEDATFADAVAKLTKNSEERPLSVIDRNTQDHILGEFSDTQEEMRMAKAQRAMEKQQQLQDDFLMGMQFGLGGHMSPMGIVPDSDNISFFDKMENAFADGGGIHIDPSKKGTFKAQASKMGMGVQEAASHILAHKENYSPAMVKKANFARNFAHAFGGSLFENPFGEVNKFDLGGEIKTVVNNLRKSGLNDDLIDEWIYKNKPEWRTEYFKNHRLTNNWQAGTDGIKYVKPQAATSNRETENGGKSQSAAASQKSGTKSKATSSVATKPKGATGLNLYDWYRNGSDGISKPTGFKVGQNGKAYDYTQKYKDLVNSLGADDIRKWAAEHPDDPSLKSFLAKGNDLSKLTDDQWRTGATDGKYGFMHHVADQIGKEQTGTRAMTDEEFASEYPMIARPADETASVDWTDGSIWGNEGTTKAVESPVVTPKKTSFKPKQTWTRNIPWMMSGIMGLKEMLTPADYGNADLVLDAAYRAGQPISVGTEYIGDYRKRNPFNEQYLTDIINQRGAATSRNIMNVSGGNRAVAMSGIMTNDLIRSTALAEAARQGYLANRADDASVAEFNKNTNLENMRAQNQRNQFLASLNSQRQNAMLSGIGMGARMRQAIKDQRDAAISANWTNFAQSLGDKGKENGYYNMLGGLNDEGILKYFYGDNWRTKFNNTQEEV